MKLIIKPRGMGKTHDLIYWAHKTGIPIVTVYFISHLLIFNSISKIQIVISIVLLFD